MVSVSGDKFLALRLVHCQVGTYGRGPVKHGPRWTVAWFTHKCTHYVYAMKGSTKQVWWCCIGVGVILSATPSKVVVVCGPMLKQCYILATSNSQGALHQKRVYFRCVRKGDSCSVFYYLKA